MRPRRSSVVLLAGLLCVAACGTRLPDEAFAPSTQVVSADGSEGGDDFSAGDPDDAAGSERAGDSDAGRDRTVPSGGTDASAPGGETGGNNGSAGSPEAPDPSGQGPNQASDVGVTETTIKIGNITAENGVLGDTFAPAVRGLRAWAQATNAAGGIHGRKVELFTCDDREDRSRSLECARRLVEQDQVFALVATNSRALGGASQYLADQGVPVLGFPISNAFYRYPNFFTIYGTGYPRDGQSVGNGGELVSPSGQYRWYKENLGVTKAAVFNYDIAESSQAGDSFVAGLEAEGFEVQQYTVSFAAPSFDQAVADMQRRGTQIVLDAMDDGANRRLCDSMARRGFEPEAKVSTVVIMGEGAGARYNDTCRNILYVPTESRPYTGSHPEVVEVREAYARYQPGLPLHQWALEAWAMGNITAGALESMGPAPTREGFIEFLNSMPPNQGGGIMVGTDFRPSAYNYDAPTSKDCFAVMRFQEDRGGWTPATDSFPFCYPDAKNVATTAREQGN